MNSNTWWRRLSKRKVVFSVKLDEETLESIRAYIEETGYWESVGSFIRWLIRMYFKKRGVVP